MALSLSQRHRTERFDRSKLPAIVINDVINTAGVVTVMSVFYVGLNQRKSPPRIRLVPPPRE